MFGAATPYLVAVCTVLFAALSAITLITAVKHFDRPEDTPHR
jgi:hypothetical protein